RLAARRCHATDIRSGTRRARTVRPGPPRARRMRWCLTAFRPYGGVQRIPRLSWRPPFAWHVTYHQYQIYPWSEMPVKAPRERPRREEYSEATRTALLDAAAVAFATQGFARTSVDDIVRRARVTKGALYHHFRDKTAVFEAVFCRIEETLVHKVGEASGKH